MAQVQIVVGDVTIGIEDEDKSAKQLLALAHEAVSVTAALVQIVREGGEPE
jgi:hypothetical protein